MPNLHLTAAPHTQATPASARTVVDLAPSRRTDTGRKAHWFRRLFVRVARATQTLHRIIGAPDYEAYVTHARRCHPEAPLLTRDEFVRQRLEDRYSRPGARCC